jgi:hypothetical protein
METAPDSQGIGRRPLLSKIQLTHSRAQDSGLSSSESGNCSGSATETGTGGQIIGDDYSGSLQRYCFIFASNAVSRRLLKRFSPSSHPLLRMNTIGGMTKISSCRSGKPFQSVKYLQKGRSGFNFALTYFLNKALITSRQ